MASLRAGSVWPAHAVNYLGIIDRKAPISGETRRSGGLLQSCNRSYLAKTATIIKIKEKTAVLPPQATLAPYTGVSPAARRKPLSSHSWRGLVFSMR